MTRTLAELIDELKWEARGCEYACLVVGFDDHMDSVSSYQEEDSAIGSLHEMIECGGVPLGFVRWGETGCGYRVLEELAGIEVILGGLRAFVETAIGFTMMCEISALGVVN